MNKSEHIKKQIVAALEQSLGVVSSACRKVGISRTTFYKYYKDDPKFQSECKEIEEFALDYAESQLHKQIGEGSTAATIFYLKTKGKKRGYVERQEITGADGENLFSIKVVDARDTDE
tara:strand:- start:3222 stop:3575 length:354 start_codon:yes stop_codon:yes gene_type:complete